MKKNLLKKTMALSLALVMGLAANTLANDGATSSVGSGSIPGTSTVKDPIYRVVLPTNVDFAIDAFEQASIVEGSQISAAHYAVLNKSNIPMKVSLDATVKLKSNVNLKAEEDIDPTDTTNTDKDIFFAMAPAVSGLTLDSTADTAKYLNTNTGSAGTTPVYATTSELQAAVATAEADKAKANLTFALDAADYAAPTDSVPTSTLVDGALPAESFSAFTFVGKVNPNVAWGAGDVVVKMSYDIRGISTTAYTALTTDNKWVTGPLNLLNVAGAENAPGATVIEPSPSPSPTPTPDPSQAPTVTPQGNGTLSKGGKNNVVYTYDLGLGAEAATGTVVKVSLNDGQLRAPTIGSAVTVNETAKTVTFVGTTGINGWNVSTGNGWIVTFEFTNGKTATAYLKITA